MNIERLKTVLRMTDRELINYLVTKYSDPTSGYAVQTDSVNFVFCVPVTEQICPVLLQAHIDTKRVVTVDEPLILCSEHGVLTNANGILGGDDRCGVAGMLEIEEMHTSKPFLLFTNYEEVGGLGMKAFLTGDLINSYIDMIYLCLALDRRGHNEYVYYSPNIPDELAAKLTKLGYFVAQGSYSDCRDLWFDTDICAINVSVGYGQQHTADEFILMESYVSSILRADRLMQMIDKPMRVHDRYTYAGLYKTTVKDIKPADNADKGTAVIDVTPHASDDGPSEDIWMYTTKPRCLVCNHDDRELMYDVDLGAKLCVVCRKQIEKHYGSITQDNMFAYMDLLAELRRKSREANRNLNSKKNKSAMPICPGCKDNKDVMWSRKDIGFICSACSEYPHDGYDGRFWIKNNTKIYVKDDKVLTTNMEVTKLLSSESVSSHQCAVCKKYHPLATCETLGKNRKVNAYVCPSCKQEALSTILNNDLPPWDMN